MKKMSYLVITLATLCSMSMAHGHEAPAAKIRILNFKKCAETSTLGKQEQTSLEALKKQMETILGEREKVLNDMAEKLEDPDHLDSLSPEAETDLKRKFRAQSQEFAQLQQQYVQTLQQSHMKVLQKLSDEVAKAAKIVAGEINVDLILNDEAGFFASPKLDVSDLIVKKMNELYASEGEHKTETPALSK